MLREYNKIRSHYINNMVRTMFRFILIAVLVPSYFCQDIKEVTPDHFPYQAHVKSDFWFTSGALISIKHVITQSDPVKGSRDATVYLGFHGFPQVKKYRNEPLGQIIKSERIIIHSNFANISGKYISNVAVIVLKQPVQLSSSVHPIDLSTVAPSPGTYANLSGWEAERDNKLQYHPVRLYDIDTCIYKHGPTILPNQELCFQKAALLNVAGSPMAANKKLIGLATYNAKCMTYLKNCSRDVMLNLFPFVLWIHTQIGIKPHPIKSQELQNLEALLETNKQQLTYIKGLQNTQMEAINRIVNNDLKQTEELRRLNHLVETKSNEYKTCYSNISHLQQSIDKITENYNHLKKEIDYLLFGQDRNNKENKDIISDIKKTDQTLYKLIEKLSGILWMPEET
ncbi:brachyurin-like isoform X1 [Rhynchophorus ferrugineus]|uniref:brachyurin-like isoform X1 n=2 Tax=Rhynchophorus ferrugineus TaxID=354439 RepID=UPI003FCD7866